MRPVMQLAFARSVFSVLVPLSCFCLATAIHAADTPPVNGGGLPHMPQGPAPKPAHLSDGKPNWTGFWVPLMFYIGDTHGPRPPGGAPGPLPPGAPGALPPGGLPPGGGLPRGGLAAAFAAPHNAPLKSPYKEEYQHDLAITASGVVARDTNALCIPPGMPSMMVAIYGLEVLQTPGQITLTAEWPGESRRIWVDGRPHPKDEDLIDTYAGHSIGHWEGNVLVVDTVGLRSDTKVGITNLPHDDKLHLIERFASPQPGVLVDEITIDDPTVYEGIWSYTERYRYRPDLNLEEYVCEENNRNVGANGEPEFGGK